MYLICRFIIGKDGANIRKIREDTGTKIELPPEEDDKNDTIVITGKKEAALEAKSRINKILDEFVNVTQDEVNIPYKFHNYLIGTKGKLIQSIKDECGGVTIKFPPQESKSDKVGKSKFMKCYTNQPPVVVPGSIPALCLELKLHSAS
jgi:Polyribonucleotide nucleotidyltransferase (polynucleotide phosphorylase)